ncbi:MAG TPA: SUF system NifU family Fe-S cluster assembly protein [Blastocatellia bacterium]|nr:SUF system NifU family Fe-S cluster assembly protein [Blastocatellia bacterium]
MDNLGNLYQEVILDHSRRPRNFRKMEGASRKADGYNPLCGDRVTIYLSMDGDVVKDASFQGSGCAISTSSASILTESMKGKTRAEAEALFETFHDLVTGERNAKPDAPELGKLAVFSGVSEFPARVKCATLSWHTLRAALDSPNVDEAAQVSTE